MKTKMDDYEDFIQTIDKLTDFSNELLDDVAPENLYMAFGYLRENFRSIFLNDQSVKQTKDL